MNSANLPYIVMTVVLLVLFCIAGAALYAHSRRKDEQRIQEQCTTISNQEDSIESLKLRVGHLLESKDKAYDERNIMVALLARTLMDNGLVGDAPGQWRIFRGETPEFVGWEPAIYFVPPPETGLLQLNWHFRRNHVHLVEQLGLPEAPPNFWDGRSREQKYENIRAYLQG